MINPLGDIFSPGTVSALDAVLAVLVLVAAFVVAHYVRRGISTMSARWPGLHPELVSLTGRLAKYAIILLAIGIDLALLGANIQPVLAAVILIGVIGVLALRGVAANFGAAVILQSRRAIHVGQEIEVLDVVGVVSEFNSRSVIVHTRDGRVIHVPNTTILSNPWTNDSQLGGRRSELEVRLETDGSTTDLDAVLMLVHDAAQSASGVHARPATTVLVRSLSPGRATLEVQIWHAPRHDQQALSSAVMATFEALASAGIRATVVAPVPEQPLTLPPQP